MAKKTVSDAEIAEALDAVLMESRTWYNLPAESEDEVAAAGERERLAAERLAGLTSPAPARLLAQLCYACIDPDCNGDQMFGVQGLQRFDFANVAAESDNLRWRMLASVVCRLEELCAGGEVAAVIAKHRALVASDAEFESECDHKLAPLEAVRERVNDLDVKRDLCRFETAMRVLMDENRRLAEQLAATQQQESSQAPSTA